MGRDHERGVRAPDRTDLPLRGDARTSDGGRHLRVLRRADRPRGRPAARRLGRPRHHRRDPGVSRATASRSRSRSQRPGRHQHRTGGGRTGRVGPPPGVHGDGRRGERRGPDGADRRAGDGPDHGRDVSTDRLVLRRRVARRGRGQGEDGAGACVPGRRPEATAGDALANARHPARRPRARDGDPHARDRRRARGSRPDRVADRRGRSGQEPVDRRDTAGMGEASTRRRPAQHLGRPADLGDLAVRFLRHDTALRAVSPDAGPDRRDRRHRPAARRPGEVGTDHRLLRGVGGTSHARLARTVRCAGARRRAARGGGVQGRDHGAGPGIDPPLRAPNRGSWCSRTSTGATRRRWTC